MGKQDTWMPLYVGDYLADTGHLSAAEHGAYLLMLMHYWRTATALPGDAEKLRRICRMNEAEWSYSKDTLSAFFSVRDGCWRHQRVEDELALARDRSEKARASAEKRWGRPPEATAQPPQSEGNANASPEQCSSPSPSPSPESSQSKSPIVKPSVSPPRANRAPAEPLPADWKPDDDEIGLAKSLGLDADDLEREKNKYVWFYTKGKGAGMRCTPRGWRQRWGNWLGKAVERLPEHREGQNLQRQERPREISWRWAGGLGDGVKQSISEKFRGLSRDLAWLWVRNCEIDIDGGALVLRAPNRLAVDHLSTQGDSELRRIWGGNVVVSLMSDRRAA